MNEYRVIVDFKMASEHELDRQKLIAHIQPALNYFLLDICREVGVAITNPKAVCVEIRLDHGGLFDNRANLFKP